MNTTNFKSKILGEHYNTYTHTYTGDFAIPIGSPSGTTHFNPYTGDFTIHIGSPSDAALPLPHWLKGSPYEVRQGEPVPIFIIDSLQTLSNKIEKVVFNEPATIILWRDGGKTVVKAQDGEPFDKEKGFLMAIAKKLGENKGNYNNIIKQWCK